MDAKPARLETVLDGGGRRSERADSQTMTDGQDKSDVGLIAKMPHWVIKGNLDLRYP